MPTTQIEIPCRWAEVGCAKRAEAVYYSGFVARRWTDPVQALCADHAKVNEFICRIVDLTALERLDALERQVQLVTTQAEVVRLIALGADPAPEAFLGYG